MFYSQNFHCEHETMFRIAVLIAALLLIQNTHGWVYDNQTETVGLPYCSQLEKPAVAKIYPLANGYTKIIFGAFYFIDSQGLVHATNNSLLMIITASNVNNNTLSVQNYGMYYWDEADVNLTSNCIDAFKSHWGTDAYSNVYSGEVEYWCYHQHASFYWWPYYTTTAAFPTNETESIMQFFVESPGYPTSPEYYMISCDPSTGVYFFNVTYCPTIAPASTWVSNAVCPIYSGTNSSYTTSRDPEVLLFNMGQRVNTTNSVPVSYFIGSSALSLPKLRKRLSTINLKSV